MMTRPKSEPGKRRIIVDLSYPHGGVNDYIHPHMYNGQEAVHALPTIADLLAEIRDANSQDTKLAVVDISRAYRHFPTCPLDWPLLVLYQDGKYYFDRATPFGARMSSYVMQSAAQFVIRALGARGIKALMYLDDLILVTNTQAQDQHYAAVLTLLRSLSLEVAQHKLQPPARRVVWLGIEVDLDANTIAIPTPKLQEIQQGLANASRQKSLTKKALQRAVGQINHLSKVVAPARLFMGRLLAAIRGKGHPRIRVTPSMKADFAWSRRFLKDYNGRAIIPPLLKKREIWADSCLKGGSATDGRLCYTYTYPEAMATAHHITHLEAINCLAAARIFTTPEDKGNVVVINCDNQLAVDAYRGGRAHDPVLSARAFWFLGAKNEVVYQFNHVPGELMGVPDALSRVMLADKYKLQADSYVEEMALTWVRAPHRAFTFTSFYF